MSPGEFFLLCDGWGALHDGNGDRCEIEHDTRDGRTYLTITFDGKPAPFALNAKRAADLASRLATVAAILKARETPPAGRENGHSEVRR